MKSSLLSTFTGLCICLPAERLVVTNQLFGVLPTHYAVFRYVFLPGCQRLEMRDSCWEQYFSVNYAVFGSLN